MTNAHVRMVASLEHHPHWVDLIRAANRHAGDVAVFGRPQIGPWWAGGTVEEYPEARVIHRDDGTVSITSKTDRAGQALRAAAAELGLVAQETVSFNPTRDQGP